MARKQFYSQLFKKTIEADDKEYKVKVLAEALYRLKEYEVRNCSCMICQSTKQKLKEYIEGKFNFKSS